MLEFLQLFQYWMDNILPYFAKLSLAGIPLTIVAWLLKKLGPKNLNKKILEILIILGLIGPVTVIVSILAGALVLFIGAAVTNNCVNC